MKEDDLAHHVLVAEQLLTAIDSPRALTVCILLRNRMWDDIANLKLDPNGYFSPEKFERDYQATKLLSKAEWLPTSIDRRAVAKAKFLEAENLCRRTNEFWGQYRRAKVSLLRKKKAFQPDYEQIFFSARRKIGLVLGSQLYRWVDFCDFGPGADSSTLHGMTSAYNKLSEPGSVTLNCLPYLNAFCSLTRVGCLFTSSLELGRLEIEIAKGNKVTFVPKNAKTDRPIAVEPRWNIFFQKGVGRFIRNRLKSFGVNLSDQSINQRRALLGARTGNYATIDLASASDTISKELVQALLPDPWLDLLGALRSPAYYLDGKWQSYEKWSSMGNGYTFELESLLFWAISSSVDEDVSVYGDDLVVPSKSFETIVKVLQLCGFETNESKSFSSGLFRESCGVDAFASSDVSPIYWKPALDEMGTLRLANQISRLAQKWGSPFHRDKSFLPAWRTLVYSLPKRFQTRGPVSLSSVVHDSQSRWNVCRKWGWDGLFINALIPEPRKFQYSKYEAAIVSQHFQPSSDGFSVRDRYVWRKRTVFIPSGYEDVGPWA